MDEGARLSGWRPRVFPADMQTLFLILVLVPAPKPAMPPVHPLVGAMAIDWGWTRQTTFIQADGTCWSPEFSAGTWVELDDGSVWFSERDGTTHYVMKVVGGVGQGWSVTDGIMGDVVEVRMRRGERLPAPMAK